MGFYFPPLGAFNAFEDTPLLAAVHRIKFVDFYGWMYFLERTMIRKMFQEGFMMILIDRIELNPRVCNGKPV
ncbi:hypothetical protein KKG29_05710, partial [Patescibacteria group bacterium]|nr:hypothetical protein [Patescibacteria group bacterium]